MRKLSLFLCMIFIPSCATLVEESNHKVYVQAKDKSTGDVINEAQCSVEYKGNVLFTAKTPFEVEVNSRKVGYIVICNAPGYASTQVLLPRINTASFERGIRNSITFIGGAVDIMSNANEKYANLVTVLMEKSHA